MLESTPTNVLLVAIIAGAVLFLLVVLLRWIARNIVQHTAEQRDRRSQIDLDYDTMGEKYEP